MIVVDSREPQKIVRPIIDRLSKQLNEPYTIKCLEKGDYDLGEGWVIESKTIADFYSSITQDVRFFRQFPSMAMDPEIKRPIFALIGYPEELEGVVDYNPNVLYGAIASLIVRYGFEFSWFKDRWQFLNVVMRVSKKISEGKINVPRRFMKVNYLRDPEAQKIHFLCGISGISPNIARSLLRKFKTLKAIANASKEELERVEGIGEARALKLWRIFNEL